MGNHELNHRGLVGLIFILIDLIMIATTIGIYNISSLSQEFASLFGILWVILLIAGFITCVLAIIFISSFPALRATLIQAFLVIVFSFWIGLGRVPLLEGKAGGNTIVFLIGSLCFIAMNVLIQIDLLFETSLQRFFIGDAKRKAYTVQERTVTTGRTPARPRPTVTAGERTPSRPRPVTAAQSDNTVQQNRKQQTSQLFQEIDFLSPSGIARDNTEAVRQKRAAREASRQLRGTDQTKTANTQRIPVQKPTVRTSTTSRQTVDATQATQKNASRPRPVTNNPSGDSLFFTITAPDPKPTITRNEFE